MGDLILISTSKTQEPVENMVWSLQTLTHRLSSDTTKLVKCDTRYLDLYKYESVCVCVCVCLSVCVFAFFSAIWNPIGIPFGTNVLFDLEMVLT